MLQLLFVHHVIAIQTTVHIRCCNDEFYDSHKDYTLKQEPVQTIDMDME